MAASFWNKVALVTARVVFLSNQLASLAPLRWHRREVQAGFRTHPIATLRAFVSCVVVTVSGPFLACATASMYRKNVTRFDSSFSAILLPTLASGMALSATLLWLQVWRRRALAELLNLLLRLHCQLQAYTPLVVDKRTLLSVWLGLAFTLYSFASVLPLLSEYLHSVSSAEAILAFLFFCVEHVSAVFALDVVAALLLFGAFGRCLERVVQQVASGSRSAREAEACVADLVAIECLLHRVVQLFMSTSELGILLLLIYKLVQLLSNLFALLEAITVYKTVAAEQTFFILMIFANLCVLNLAAQLCGDGAQRVNWAFLELEASWLASSGEADELPLSALRWQQVVPLQMDFPVLGLFSLGNHFILFIFGYSVSFFLFILEFEVKRSMRG